ncbi:MAG: 23S rRNA (adenine(2503)-C(2))-methyltransferase RlmN [Planctomycetota bacterium]|nr:23S rRNA (adenine(2503)-C(2))-methyltransferase RlmN [Planctomycetota bacterium]
MNHPINHIFEHTPETLAAWCESHRMPAFRAKQILEWVYEKGVCEPEKMSNLSKLDRETLARDMTFLSGRTLAHQKASDGVQKLLIEWEDEEKSGSQEVAKSGAGVTNEAPPGPVPLGGGAIALPQAKATGSANAKGDTARQTECVMIPTDDRKTACISSQVGCPVGCRFCASGLGGLDGNLSAGRIVEQVWRLGRLPSVERISNVVFMGMGEPLSNFQNVTRAIRILASLWATGVSARKITISTVGLPQAIRKLAEQFELPVTLALSLHAPTDDIRRSLIPWAEYTTIKDLLAACQEWFDKTGREITLEYTLLYAINDKPEHAQELARLAKTLRANINLIRYNEVKDLPFKRPLDADVLAFQKVLKDKGVNVHIRASRGRDIAAACGQLRHESAKAGA